MTDKATYPKIYAVTELIALDNGGINRDRSAERREDELELWLIDQDADKLAKIEAWLATRSEYQLALVASGMEGDSRTWAALEGAPATLGDFLNDYFDAVC